MAEIIIKKKVDLGFLGDDYKDDYLVFKSLPINMLTELDKKFKAVEKDNQKATALTLDVLKERFVEGSFQGQKVQAGDIGEFDLDTMSTVFKTLTGQLDPKVETQ